MLAKFVEAFRLLFSNIALFSAIILTVWLPANLVTSYLAFYSPSDDEFSRSFRINQVVTLVFDPISIGALIYALSRLKSGERPGYFESIAFGFRNWPRLLVVRLLVGIWIGFGLLLLVLPGVVLAVRYALTSPVALVEHAGTDKARHRSTELTRGVRWQIFWAWALDSVVFVPAPYLIYFALGEYFPHLDTIATEVALDSVMDVANSVIEIVMFLYYWQAVEREKTAPAVDE
jgi:hypothetical protein